jgi:hypothetical protein
MSTRKGAADPAWWTQERREAKSRELKANPRGAFSKDWWADRPEAREASRERMLEVWRRARANGGE